MGAGNQSAILYLYRKSFKNRVKKAVRKPVTYVYTVLILIYTIAIFSSLGMIIKEMGTDKAAALTAFMTVSAFVFIPSNLISYSKRKGLVFKNADVHFLFPAPISPKRVLFYAHIRMILTALVLTAFITIGGVLWFDMPVWKMLIYCFFSCIVENVLEAALMILCYGNERRNKKQMLAVQILMYAIIGLFVLIGIIVYVQKGASVSVVMEYLHSPAIQMVPVLGWYIAFIHLLFMGASVLNIIGSVLFFLTVVVLFIMARRMKCTGEYYEDAMKFAEDYEVAREKGKKGEVTVVGWKKKYKKATVHYKGNYAKAIFYRQLLEYKKNKFFIFGFYTLLCLAVGIGLAFLSSSGEIKEHAPFIILGAMAYIAFIFSSYAGKWGKELAKPYTYLIPDSAFHKLWYATLIEHIRALIDGCLITIPAGIVLKMPVLQMLLIIAIYVCLQACKLYAEVMIEAFLGNILGTVGKQFARLFFEGLVILFGIAGAAIGTILFSLEAGLTILIIIFLIMTLGMMAIAAMNFERMESLE